VASSRKTNFLVIDPKEFYEGFPHLNAHNHKLTSKATPQPWVASRPYYVYNCFAFVVGDKRRFWWPDDEDGYWPRDGAPNTVDEIMSVLSEFDYEECDGSYEPGVQKVAIFVNGDVPVHVAVQPSSRHGVWKSKMGYNVDIEHDLHAIESWDEDDASYQGYGKAVKFMRLKRKK
jgi:hypothetical protein